MTTPGEGGFGQWDRAGEMAGEVWDVLGCGGTCPWPSAWTWVFLSQSSKALRGNAGRNGIDCRKTRMPRCDLQALRPAKTSLKLQEVGFTIPAIHSSSVGPISSGVIAMAWENPKWSEKLNGGERDALASQYPCQGCSDAESDHNRLAIDARLATRWRN